MLRISEMADREGAVLRLEGRVVDQWVGLLRETCEHLQRKTGTPLVLDLAAVEFASKEGVDLLRRLQDQGARCVSWSPFLKELVRDDS